MWCATSVFLLIIVMANWFDRYLDSDGSESVDGESDGKRVCLEVI